MKIKYLLIFILPLFISSCNKNIENDNMDYDVNSTSKTYENPYINYSINNKNNYSIIAYPDSVNKRLSIGYGSGNIIGTDTCLPHYSCSFISSFDTSNIEIKIEFYNIENKQNLKEYYGAYYYPTIIELGNNLLYSGSRNIIYKNDFEYYPGVRITYLDSLGNYFYSTDTVQLQSYFVINTSNKVRDFYYGTCQKLDGSFSMQLRNLSGDSLINFSGTFLGIYNNPI